ncbi:LacI family DNA-binding transcriptional regulator [Salinisphaera sp. LB1]|uniref:LacI family DNA-binding transcriptional regulator n=1 Tax=Salinisphaera sp. LB1 TaxID=2183911 RepID=UPI000D705245|nr:LacI family DNA-binding transcriptional regulator [Salinisphaera sp. LB1]AWN15863.1 Transcriptional regulator [Salinisphaera sp. LB1]
MSVDHGSSASVVARQVAEALGVSISTVSRAFTPNSVIADSTRRRVLRKAAQLGYQPNPHARSLKTNRSRIVAIVVSDLANPFYPEVLTGLSEALEYNGFSVMLFCRHRAKTLDDTFHSAFRYQPDVLVALAATMSSAAIDSAVAAGIAVVLFNRYVPGNSSIAVTCDNEAGGEAVANYLVDRQLTRLAYVAGDLDATTNRDREIGFIRACRRRGLSKPKSIQAQRFTHDAGLAAGRLLIDRHRGDIDGVFCANDVLALGVLDAMREQGIGVPDELSVIGFDDIAMAGWASYQLTTYRQPVEEMIAATADVISEMSRAGFSAGTRINIPGHIVSRHTVSEVM